MAFSQPRSKANTIFQQVDYRQFRQHLDSISAGKVKEKNFETMVYDRSGKLQAIVHAAAIDKDGNCFPAQYFVLTEVISHTMPEVLLAA